MKKNNIFRWSKSTLILLFCFIFAVSEVIPVFAADSIIKRPQKIVSVVYDDSDSMRGAPWGYADYAVQTFISMLDKSDELFITYMSGENDSVSVNLNKMQKEIDALRKHNKKASTPVQAIRTAYDKLTSVKDAEKNAQYWLVMFTDGKILKSSESLDSDTVDVNKILTDYKGKTMPNGTQLNIDYLAIGANAQEAADDKANGLNTYIAGTDTEIYSQLTEIAKQVSGRLECTNVTAVNSKEISVSSTLPLMSISVLSQQSSAKVTSAKADSKLDVERNISVMYSDEKGWKEITTGVNLYGNSAVISNKGKVIPAGSYTISFSEDIDLNNLLVSFEPAIGLKLKITKDKKTIDPSKAGLVADDQICASLYPVEYGTDKVIDFSLFPEGAKMALNYSVDGKKIDSSSTDSLGPVSLKEGKNRITGTLTFPGFVPFTVYKDFSIESVVYDYGIEPVVPDNLEYYRYKLSRNEENAQFYLTDAGKRIPADKIKDASLSVTDVTVDDSNVKGFFDRLGKKEAGFRIKKNDDGSFTLIPKSVGLFPYAIKAGRYTVEVTLNKDNSVKATAELNVIPSLRDYLFIILLFILLFIIGAIIKSVFFKTHFSTGIYTVTNHSVNGDVTRSSPAELIKVNKFTDWYAFWRSESIAKIKSQNMTLFADVSGFAIIKGSEISKKCTHYLTRQNVDLETVPEWLHEKPREPNIAPDIQVSERSSYLTDDETRTAFWSIKQENG